jgi:glycosyltransferase involved in cell wall biosynthesis
LSRLKIALVADHFAPRVGGIELHVADLARQLAGRGHEVAVITTTPGPESSGAVCVHRLYTSLLPHFQILWHPGAVVELRRLLAAERFDVVHAHSSVVSPLTYSALGLARHLRLASVLTVHSYWNLAAINMRALSWVWPWNHAACQLTGVSRFVAQRLAVAAGRHDVAVLPNFIDLESWPIAQELHAHRRVTSVLRLNRKKQPHQLLCAIAKVVERLGGGNPVRFTIIGDGPLRKPLEREVCRLGIDGVVEFLGFQPREMVRQVFRTTDLFVHPTRYEAFGLAVLEACAARLPIVAMNHGGVRDIIQLGQQGHLANTRAEFVKLICELLRDEQRRHQLSDAPRDHLQQFTSDRVIGQHLEVYAAAQAAVKRRLPSGLAGTCVP